MVNLMESKTFMLFYKVYVNDFIPIVAIHPRKDNKPKLETLIYTNLIYELEKTN